VSKKLENYTVAILVADGFEESEMVQPRSALQEVGATAHIISPEEGSVRSWVHGNWSKEYSVDLLLDVAHASKYDALLLPGGVMNPDKLRLHKKAIDFIVEMGRARKPIAAICHGSWPLINAGLVSGKTMTSWPSIRIDLENAGATWIDNEVVVDGQLVTSRKPDDIPAFNEAMIALFAKSQAQKMIESR